MKRVSYLLAACCLLVAAKGKAQSGTIDSVKMIVAQMAAHNLYEMSYTVGYAGSVSGQYQRWERLAALASGEQLDSLARTHPSPVVRLYSFKAIERRYPALVPSLEGALRKDTARVRTLKGDEARDRPLASLLDETLFEGIYFQGN